MRRIILVGLLFASACLSGGTGPTDVTGFQVTNNAPPSGVFVGDHVQVNAAAIDILGNVVPVTLTFTSSSPAVATIDAAGLITAVGAGTSSITVSGGGQSATLTLTVDGNISQSMQLSTSIAQVAAGQFVQLSATVMTTLGNPARNKTVNWSTSDATKATVDMTGKVSGIAATPAVSICATAADAPAVKACAAITVQ